MSADHTIPVLKKAIALLKAVAAGENGPTSTKALAQTLGLPHSTAYRILQTFLAEDWIRPTAGGQHEISFGLLPLLAPFQRHELLIDTVRAPLVQLAQTTGATAKISIRQGDHAITIFRVESPLPTSVSVKVGAAFHLALGSSGAVLLSALPPGARERVLAEAPADCWSHQSPADVQARLDELARTGLCADLGQYRPDHCALSVPLHDRQGAVVAALTVVGFPQAFEPAPRQALARQLLATAALCNQRLQGPTPVAA